MILSQETIARIEDYIEDVEICDEDDIGKDNYAEIEADGIVLLFTFIVFAHYVEEFNYHSEVPYNNIEDLSHYEFDDASITELKAYDENGKTIEISNKNEIKYW